jgi:hypothetical protein
VRVRVGLRVGVGVGPNESNLPGLQAAASRLIASMKDPARIKEFFVINRYTPMNLFDLVGR